MASNILIMDCTTTGGSSNQFQGALSEICNTQRLREKILIVPSFSQGHFEQIEKRQRYLSEQVLSIAKTLAWPISVDTLPKIVTIYLTRLTYWWTRFPPREVSALFLRVDMLAKFIEEL